MTGTAARARSACARLLPHPDLWRASELAGVATPSLSTGFPALDAELPGGGWPTGRLTEILPAHEGIGELRLFGFALAGLSAADKPLAWIAPPYRPYAPALAAAGIEPTRLTIVRTRNAQEALWAAEQALVSRAFGAVLAWLGAIRYPELRRLQLAAEGSRVLAVLFRPAKAAAGPSPASLRISLAGTAGSLSVHILKRRGAPFARPLLLALPGNAGRNGAKKTCPEQTTV